MKIANIKVDYINHCGDDLSVVNAARVSFDKESKWEIDPNINEKYLSDKDKKLIHYLAKHKHLSPFNHCFISVRVKAPIFVARQLVKHEYLPWNEVSRRYVDSEPEFYMPDVWRAKASNVKQGSANEEVKEIVDCYGRKYPVSHATKSVVDYSLELYNDMKEAGVCPEQARMILPQNTMTEWIWSGTLGAFAKMLGLRLDGHTQKETRDVAVLIRDIVEPLFPVSLNALLEFK